MQYSMVVQADSTFSRGSRALHNTGKYRALIPAVFSRHMLVVLVDRRSADPTA